MKILEPAELAKRKQENESQERGSGVGGGEGGNSERTKKALLLAWIVHAIAFIFGFLHWIFYWASCHIKNASGTGYCSGGDHMSNRYYSRFLIVVWCLWLIAIAVNFFVD